MGHVPQKPKNPKIVPPKSGTASVRVVCNDMKTPGPWREAWECEYCHTFNTTEKEKCHNCGAPKVSESVMPDPSTVVAPPEPPPCRRFKG